MGSRIAAIPTGNAGGIRPRKGSTLRNPAARGQATGRGLSGLDPAAKGAPSFVPALREPERPPGSAALKRQPEPTMKIKTLG